MNTVWKDWARIILEALVIIVILYMALWPVRIEGISMENTLHDKDRVFISRLMTKMSLYEPGDLVVFDWEINGKPLHVIKRIIAVEGDTVSIENGVVTVNGKVLSEEYAFGETAGNMKQQVPEGCIFVLGDNRNHSEDSRHMGAIPQDRLVGKVLFRWYPLNSITGF